MYLAIQRKPIPMQEGKVIEVPMSHPMETRKEVDIWIMERGLRSQALTVALSTFISWGGLEPGRNR